MNAPSLGPARSVLAEVADAALELTVVGSFSRLGFDARKRLFGWTDPPAGSLAGKVALVTGASSGLGLATALGLAELGAQVVLLGRDPRRTEDARVLIERQTGSSDLRMVVADLARLDDVRRTAAEIINTCDRLDVVVHNAGSLTRHFERTVDGLEVTAQTHVVAPFLLTALLLERLATSQGRVITVTSGGMYSTGLDLDGLVSPEAGSFDGVKAYTNAKRAQVVLNEQWAARFGRSGITFQAMHPGWADTAGVRSSLPGFHRVMGPILRTPAQGVDTTLWLAAAADPRCSNGELWLDRHPRRTVHLPRTSVSEAEADRLWDWCVSAAGSDAEIPSQPRDRAARLADGGCPIMTTPRQEHHMRIAIVGTGISGLVCAHLLHPRHDITVFEAGAYVGGHTNTVRVDIDGETHHVDTGFIVHNDRNYPNFVKLMNQLGVATQPSDMSFSVSDRGSGLEYRGTNLNTIFAQRRNLARPSFLRMLSDIVRFNRSAKRLLADSTAPDDSVSLEQFLRDGSYSPAFIEQFLIPLGASIWSADPETFTQFPALAYARFMDNHGLLDLRGMPEWRTVTGGSRRYVERIIVPFADRIRLQNPIDKIVRTDAGVEVVSLLDGPETFDRVILSTHSDQALRLLADPSPAERDILSAIRYQPNVATLHTDERFLPRSPRARASWNYHLSNGEGQAATLTYWMNRLQSIESRHQFLVTLNRHGDIDPVKVLGRYDYAHPVFDAAAMAAQRRRPEIQGTRGTFFAGAYWEYGFHEDGVRSALDVCHHFGVTL